MKPKDAEALNRALATAQGILTPEQRRQKAPFSLPVPPPRPPRPPVDWGRIILTLLKGVGLLVGSVILYTVAQNFWFWPIAIVAYAVYCICQFIDASAKRTDDRLREIIHELKRNR